MKRIVTEKHFKSIEAWETFKRNNEASEEFTGSQLMYKFAMDNNRISIGDVVSDSKGSIKTTFVGVTISLEGFPFCTYHGVELDAKGNEKKAYRTIFQINLK